MPRLALILTVPLTLIYGYTYPPPPVHTSPEASARSDGDPGAADVLAGLPLTFVEDPGAADGIDYQTAWGPAAVGFARSGLNLALTDTAGTTERWGVRLDFIGGQAAVPIGLASTPDVVSYFHGRPDEWRVGLSTYSRVAYDDLWPGIDLTFSGGSGSLKYSFRLDAGADPGAIGLAWRGATVSPAEGGGLQIATPVGTLLDGAPIAWQAGPSGRTPVEASWERRADGSWGFRLGRHSDRPIVIDPEVMFTRFIGGSGNDDGQDIAVDGSGATYVVGNTQPLGGGPSDFPTVVGPDTSFNGSTDVFVAKVNPGGAGIAYAGFIGGTDFDRGEGIEIDGAGAAYVSGYTTSDSAGEGFPATVGPDTSFNGGTDVFVAKVNPAGTGLVYAGYVGGAGSEFQSEVAVDGSGAAYVVGSTGSDETTFPDLVGPDTSFNGSNDAFIAKVKADGTGFDYAGYIGGTSSDFARGVAVDGTGAAYVAGGTNSDQTTFPDLVGPDTSFNGSNDAFIAKVKSGGTALDYAGYIGGLDSESALAVAVDGSGSAYVGGSTLLDQTAEGFPAAVGPDTTFAGPANVLFGPADGFVAKVQATGGGLDYAGYIGGNDFDQVHSVAIDAVGGTVVAGNTQSTQAEDGFPAMGGPDSTFNGGIDGFVGRVLPSGTGFGYLGYIGGLKFDSATGVALDAAGIAYVTGDTNSNRATFPSLSGFSGTHRDAFVLAVAEMCRGKLATVVGTAAKDKLSGTNGADVIAAGAGSDRVNGRGGKDRICGEDGNDKLKGGGGNDKLYGDEGKDTLLGQAGRDLCVGGPKKDRAKDCETERQI